MNLVLSLTIRKIPGIFMNVSVWEQHALNN